MKKRNWKKNYTNHQIEILEFADKVESAKIGTDYHVTKILGKH